MASYQKIALYVLFDSIEQDLVHAVRAYSSGDPRLTDDEREKAVKNLTTRLESRLDPNDPADQLYGLDLFEKYQVLLRHKDRFSPDLSKYYLSLKTDFEAALPVRNAVMHGRPLTVTQYSLGFAFAQTLMSRRSKWPFLVKAFTEYARSPETLVARSIEFLESDAPDLTLNNLPLPDYDDTGFLPRPKLQKELKHKILGRNPVITVLGDGGNGKTALALHTLYDLLDSDDHSFEAVLWFSAKTSVLGVHGIERVADAVTDALELVELAADFNRGEGEPMERLRDMLQQNKILLVIDNLETVVGSEIKSLAEDVPGESKLLFTSRTPIGGDITVNVDEFTEQESLNYIRSLSQAYGVRSLRRADNDVLRRYATRLGHKPLLLKWLVLGVKSGLDGDTIVSNPKVALIYCLENVIQKLGPTARSVLTVLATLPMPPSIGIIAQVGGLSAFEADEGVSELARFGLVDSSDSEGSERLFRLRSFARSYVMRIIAPDVDLTNDIRRKFAGIEGQFRMQKQAAEYNPYVAANYIIRSASEMVSANRIRQAIRLFRSGDADKAEEIFRELKISDPCYFEVHRGEAFMASMSGDILRAISCYEEALEHGPDQAHLHYYFAGMLMRASYYDRAREEFEKALDLDPHSGAILREAGRNELFAFNHKGARDFIKRALDLPAKSDHETVVLNDLMIQCFVREIDFHIHNHSYTSAAAPLEDLLGHLGTISCSIIDSTMWEHILGVLPKLTIIERVLPEQRTLTAAVRTWIQEQSATVSTASQDVGIAGSLDEGCMRFGHMREAGRQPTFGFLVDEASGDHVFVHKSSTQSEEWREVMKGARVSYRVARNQKGLVAVDVRIEP